MLTAIAGRDRSAFPNPPRRIIRFSFNFHKSHLEEATWNGKYRSSGAPAACLNSILQDEAENEAKCTRSDVCCSGNILFVPAGKIKGSKK